MAALLPAIGTCLARMTSGEKRLARRLEDKLEDDYLVWYDVPVSFSRNKAKLTILVLVDFKNRIIWEMKPCNSRAMKRGEKQVDGYVELANKATTGPFAGTKPWRGFVFGGY